MLGQLLPTSASNRSRWVAVGAGALIVAFAIPLLRRGITMADEGYLLLQSLDMLRGKVLYRDMDAFVTPGAWFVLAALFKLVEPSVLASRIPVAASYVAMLGVSYRIVSGLTNRRCGITAVVLLMAATVWAFPAWTFAFYSPYAVLFALAAVDRLLAWRELQRKRDLLWCGALLGLSIAFKQNYGAFATFGAVAALVALRFELRQPAISALRGATADALRVGIGISLVIVPMLAYFLYQGALPALFQSLVIHPFEFGGQHDIPYLDLGELFKRELFRDQVEMLTYTAQPAYRTLPMMAWIWHLGLVERLHVLLYWAPPVIFILGASCAMRPGDPERPVDGGVFTVVAVAAAVFLGVFPRADFNHLINVYQPVIVAGAVVVPTLMRGFGDPRPTWLRVCSGAGRALLGVYVVLAAYWYFALIHYFDTPVGGKRGGVLVDQQEATRIEYGLEAIEEMSRKGSALLTVPDLAMFNFLTDRPMPSAYYNLYQHHIGHDRGTAVVEGAELHRAQLALTRYNDFFSDRVGLREYAPILAEYLATHFELLFTVGREDYMVLERLPHPRPLPEAQDLLENCDLSLGFQEIRKHLLFDALYQDPGTGREMPSAAIQTECWVQVPEEGGELVLQIGYRRPIVILEDGSLTAEIFALTGGQPRRLLRKVFPVREETDTALYAVPEAERRASLHRSPPPDEFRVDLSPYAGERLTLLLRTTRVGKVLMGIFGLHGYGTVWIQPRVIPADSRPGTG